MRKTLVSSRAIVLGNKGENNVNKVLFPVRGWKELYGEGTFGLIHQRPNDNDPYPCSVTLNGYFVEWIIGAADVDQIGVGRCELRYIDSNGMRVKSVVYDTIIRDSLGNNSIEPPDPWQSWIDNLEETAAEVISAVEDEVDSQMGEITAEAETLQPNEDATATYDNSTKKFHFGIPKGVPGSGGGGTADYTDLANKPKINNVTLSGNKTASDLSLETRGKITIGGMEYSVTRKALAITENGVTTTYYVADITGA